jgi:acyl-CoA synthetase (AMP-forming)/AMP-acid ligase II/3-hydroxymyristoyl/3-hydroxydecanoyl-(acyl carrier protein) dehydratase
MTAFTPLSHWLLTQPQQRVSFELNNEKTTADFVQRVREWVATLSSHPEIRWAVYHSDAYEFLAIIFALWQLDKVACIPGDNCPETVQHLTTRVAGFLGDFPTVMAINVTLETDTVTSWKPLKTDTIALEIYTSGSTGEPKAITKTLDQLEKELETLNVQWPVQPDVVILTTVSHQHFYGLTFRLLWPFCNGLTFSQCASEFSEDVFHLAQQYPYFALISSPTHLSRINTTLNWHEISERCSYVISSAAPLEKETSLLITSLLDTPVREVYGSSETGVIAWRTQQETIENTRWQAFPKVNVTADSNHILSVRSPYIDQDSHLTSDRVIIDASGQFDLQGRIDSIVKIEGKRVSLTAIEHRLMSHPWIKYIKVMALHRHRIETAVVSQLTQQGEAQLMIIGRRAFIQQLTLHLRPQFEPTVLPRRWRFVDLMPFNAQGKLPLAPLQALCESDPIIKWPKIIRTEQHDNTVTLHCHIPANLIYFKGHFDPHPILPGVTQIYWAEKLGQSLFDITGRFKRLETIKFLHIISPDQTVTLQLDFNAEKNTFTFRYQSEDTVHSSGRICFE